jgi:alpha-glucosidase
MRAVLDGYRDRVLIGEIYLPLDRLVAYYGEKFLGAHLLFNFALIHTAWNASAIAALILEYEKACRWEAGRTGCLATMISRGLLIA